MSVFNRLRNWMRIEAQRATSDITLPRAGKVTSYDPNRYCARVLLQPEGILTGWLPIKTEFAGNGWGDYAPPSIGQYVDVHFQQGGKGAGYIAGCFYSSQTRPLACPSGERWLVHQSGTFFKLLNDGTIETNGTFNHTGNLNVTGNITATGDITDLVGTVDESMRGMRAIFNEHVHGTSVTPTPQM